MFRLTTFAIARYIHTIIYIIYIYIFFYFIDNITDYIFFIPVIAKMALKYLKEPSIYITWIALETTGAIHINKSMERTDVINLIIMIVLSYLFCNVIT